MLFICVPMSGNLSTGVEAVIEALFLMKCASSIIKFQSKESQKSSASLISRSIKDCRFTQQHVLFDQVPEA